MAGPSLSSTGVLLPALLVTGAARPGPAQRVPAHPRAGPAQAAAVTQEAPARAAPPPSVVQTKQQVYRILSEWDRFT